MKSFESNIKSVTLVHKLGYGLCDETRDIAFSGNKLTVQPVCHAVLLICLDDVTTTQAPETTVAVTTVEVTTSTTTPSTTTTTTTETPTTKKGD